MDDPSTGEDDGHTSDAGAVPGPRRRSALPWVLGALGALLAVPLTLLAKALLVDVDKDAAWVQPLITGPSPVRRRPGRGGAGEQPAPGEPVVPEPENASEAQVSRDLEARPESAP